MSEAFSQSNGIIESLLQLFNFLPENWVYIIGVGLSVVILWSLIKIILNIIDTFV